jgi:hypothetical protein
MGLVQGRLVDGHTSFCPNQTAILANARVCVYDGRHSCCVMKKRSEAPPERSLDPLTRSPIVSAVWRAPFGDRSGQAFSKPEKVPPSQIDSIDVQPALYSPC